MRGSPQLHYQHRRVLNFQEKVKSPATIEMKKEAKHIIEEKMNKCFFTQVSEVKIQYSMPSVQVGLVMPFCDCQQ